MHAIFDYIFRNWKDKQELIKVITYKGAEEQPTMEANDVLVYILSKIQNRTSSFQSCM